MHPSDIEANKTVFWFFLQNFISSHNTYSKNREQSSMTLKQVVQTHKKFLEMIDERKTGVHSVKSLEKVLNAPLNFVTDLRSAITSSQESHAWNAKEQRVWNGIARNLQTLSHEEARATQKRGLENKLFQLELRILEYPEKVHQQGRYLLLQATVQAGTSSAGKTKWSELEAVLTSDSLLFLKKSKRHKGMFDFRSQHKLLQVISVDLVPNSLDLRITLSDTTHLLRFESQDELEKWLTEIRQHLPNSGELTERRDFFGFPISSTHSNAPSRVSTRSGMEYDGLSDQGKAPASDLEEAETKKRKKRSTSSSSNESKLQSIAAPAPASFKTTVSPSSSSTQVTSIVVADSNPSRRTTTESKRSNFMKSLSVSTISSPKIVSKSAQPRVRMAKRPTEGSATSDAPVRSGSDFSTASASPSSSSVKLTSTHQGYLSPSSPPSSESSKKKKRPESGSSSTPSLMSSASAHVITPSNSQSSVSSRTSPPAGVSRLDLSMNAGPTSPPHPRTKSDNGSNSSISSNPNSETTGGKPENSSTAVGVPSGPLNGSHKYLLHPARAVSALDHSSDYEESEDEPARLLSLNQDPNAFFKTALRDGVAQGRNLQSSSVRDLRSGSIDDMSARDPPAAPKLSFVIAPRTSSTSPSASDVDIASKSPPTSHSHDKDAPKPLEIQNIIDVVSRLESDLATLKRALGDHGILM